MERKSLNYFQKSKNSGAHCKNFVSIIYNHFRNRNSNHVVKKQKNNSAIFGPFLDLQDQKIKMTSLISKSRILLLFSSTFSKEESNRFPIKFLNRIIILFIKNLRMTSTSLSVFNHNRIGNDYRFMNTVFLIQGIYLSRISLVLNKMLQKSADLSS